MTYKAFPVKFEIIDGTELGATVEQFDECSATVIIETCVNLAAWDELSAAIRVAIVAMELEA